MVTQMEERCMVLETYGTQVSEGGSAMGILGLHAMSFLSAKGIA